MTDLGWNTWDVYHLNAAAHLPSGLRLSLIPYDRWMGEMKETFNWRSLTHSGPHSGRRMGYSRCGLKWKDTELDIEFSAEGSHLVVRVASEPEPKSGMVVLARLDGVWGASVDLRMVDDRLEAVMEDGQRWWLRVIEGDVVRIPAAVGNPHYPAFSLEQPLLIEVLPASGVVGKSALDVLRDERNNWETGRLQSEGWLEDAADGLTRSIHWNTIWEPIKGRICTPVSRDWCTGAWGGYVLFDWDTFFCAVMAGLEGPELMGDNIRAILDEITPRGFVPNFGSAVATSLDRSQPPVGAYAVLKAWQAMSLAGNPQDCSLLEETFEQLLTWHRWWMPNRDGNGDGLLEWGSDPLSDPHAWENYTLRSAMFESGLDNSPMYDNAHFNKQSHTMELADVGLNSLYAADAWALSEIAALLGRDEEAQTLHEEYLVHGERINRLMWNDTAGIYQNRYWDGSLSPSISPTNFYPLLAGIVPQEWAEQMVNEHLMNEEEFWGEFVLPSISRSDPGYRQKEVVREGIQQSTSDYWRGRIWGPMNFLVCEGLRRYGFDQEAHELALKSVRLFLKEWQEEGHVHENYDDLSGEGDNVSSADPLYHWGALLAFLGIQELADREAWEGWRFGNLDGRQAAIRKMQVAEGSLDVESRQEGLLVKLNDSLLLATDIPVIIRGYRIEEGRVFFRVSSKDACCVTVGGLPAESSVELLTHSGQLFESQKSERVNTNLGGEIDVILPGACEVEVVWRD